MDRIGFEALRRLAQGVGFALVGTAHAHPSERAGYVRQWLADGHHGEMHYLANHVETRLDPRRLVPGARSVICVADRYPARPTHGWTSARPADGGRAARGRVARYAWGDDYHGVIKKRLHKLADALRRQWPMHEFRAAVDTAPVLEREHASRAGLGWTGKHTLLINKRLGSWLLLGEIVTTLEIDPLASSAVAASGQSADHGQSEVGAPDFDAGHCGTCRRCIDACPTGCIEPYRLDAKRCISYLTIEHRGKIDAELHEAMGDWIAGCDVCQEVCPFNDPLRLDRLAGDSTVRAPAGVHRRYETRPPGPSPRLLDVLEWDAGARQQTLRGSALKRIKLDMFKRNALIAAGNYLMRHQDAALEAKVAALAADRTESELVRETARQVAEKLEQPA